MTRFPSRLFALVFLVLAATLALRAQTVRWDPAAGTLGVGQTSQLNLIFEDCEPTGELSLPKVANLNYGTPSQSSQTSIVNFKMSRRVVFSYGVLPIQRGPLTIPEFKVETDAGTLTVPAASFDVGDATVGQSNLTIDNVAGSQLTTNSGGVWAGEVFDLRYRLLIAQRFNPTGVEQLEWQAPPTIVAEPWGKVERVSTAAGGETRVGIAAATRALIAEPGLVTLPAAKQIIALETGSQAFGFFSRPNVEKYQITSSAPTITVRALPAGAPADFLKAVGQFTFESKVVPTSTSVGEPITWTLKLEGTGNWPAALSLPSREVPKSFQVLRPQTQRTMKENSLFEGTLTEDVVLVPTKPGTFRLGAVSYSYFDPKTGTYKTVRTDPVEIVVKPAAAPSTPNVVPGAPVIQFTAEPPASKTPAPTLPGKLPLQPIAGTADAWLPFRLLSPWTLLIPLAPVLALWLGLGIRRARLTDPRRGQRAALGELRALAVKLDAAKSRDELLPLVAEWQRLAALVWATGSLTPTPASLGSAVRREQPTADAEAWQKLWHEADAFRFAPPATLPDSWVARAVAVANSVRLPSQSFLAPLRWSNLLPVLALFCALGAVPRADAATEDAEAVYRRGEFAAAEKSWRAVVTAHPSDWKSRHNLGLALAQQDRWSEAAAQWSAAFLAAPRDPNVRWNLEVGLTKAEFTQPELVRFAGGQGAALFAREASPAEWQVIIVAGAVAIGFGIGALLLAVHFGARWWLSLLAAAFAVGGVLGIVAGYGALRVYGPLADRDAVLVWKSTELRTIPTEAGQQKTEPLAAGTLARGTKPFLGWQQLTLANGQTGWVRKENVVFFYR